MQFPFSYQQAGNFRSTSNVDAFNNVMETNEANNLDILNVTVNPAPIDLIITSFSIPESAVRATDVNASITVKNNGPSLQTTSPSSGSSVMAIILVRSPSSTG